MVDAILAKHDPTQFFKHPKEVVAEPTLTRAEKIAILRSWAYDEREKAVAEEENMQPTGAHADNHNLLAGILNALLILGEDTDQNRPPPTKQG